MGSIIAIVAIVMGVSIPISAIISSAVVKIKKMKLQEQNSISQKDKKLLQQALKENEELKQRIENLELVTSDPDMIKINNVKEGDLQQQIDSIKKELLRLNKENTI